jgi:hypothetical protein
MPKKLLVWIAVVALAAAAGLWWWQASQRDAVAPAEPVAVAPPASAPTEAPAAAPPAMAASDAPDPAASEPATAAVPPLPADDDSVRQALADLVGREAMLQLLQTDAFAERLVATVDNLARNHAAPRLWPVHPTDGRFLVDDQDRIAIDNAERYGAFVRMVERVPPATAAAFYRRLQPQLQSAYENLGFPGRSFHARLLDVVDHLLATPPVQPPVAVTLTDVKGPIASERPWVRYEYADPALESLSAGQKILLRVGEVHQRRLMAWLRALRAEIGR